MNYTTICFLGPSVLKIPPSNESILGRIAVNVCVCVCEVILPPHAVYLIAAAPEMREEEV